MVKYVLSCMLVFAFAVGAISSRAAEVLAIDQMKELYRRPAIVPFPKENPFTPAKAKLGEMLFFDPRLSGANYISCASCHNPGMSWGDGLAHGIGYGMTVLGRRTPTILNTAWSDLLMWDGREAALEEQALRPISNPAEMNQDITRLAQKLDAIPGYHSKFAAVFPGEGITVGNIAKAIATYERTIVSGTAPFDRWISGDEAAIPESAKRGFVLFNMKANCAVCHCGWNFSDGAFHDIGLADDDVGRGKILDLPSMQHAFKTPTLRDVERRAPYMHNGSMATLMEVIEHYDQGGLRRASLAGEVRPLHLTPEEMRDLLDFMLTLNGDDQRVKLPHLFAAQLSSDPPNARR